MEPLADTFQEFIDRPELSQHTRNKYYYRLRPFIQTHGHKQPTEITTDMIRDYIDGQKHLSDPSRSILRQSFHALLSYCGLDPNPAASLPRYRETPQHIITPDDLEVSRAWDTALAMCKSGHPVKLRDGLIFSLAVVSGNRRGEIRNLQLSDLQAALRDKSTVHRVYTTGKTGEVIMRLLPLHLPIIKDYLAIRPDIGGETAVFVNLNKTHADYGQQLSLTAFDRIRHSVCKRAGCNPISYQELRRRLATKIARQYGVDVAAHALNHSPQSGDRVIRSYYYDPDKEAVDRAITGVFEELT